MEAHYLGSTDTHSLIGLQQNCLRGCEEGRREDRGYRRERVIKEEGAGILEGKPEYRLVWDGTRVTRPLCFENIEIIH